MDSLNLKSIVIDDNTISDQDTVVRRILAVNPTSPLNIDLEPSNGGLIRLNGMSFKIADRGLRYSKEGAMSVYSNNKLQKLGLSAKDVIDYVPVQKMHLSAEDIPAYLAVSWSVKEMRAETDGLAQLKTDIDLDDLNPHRGHSHVLIGTKTGYKDKESWQEIRFYLKHGMKLVAAGKLIDEPIAYALQSGGKTINPVFLRDIIKR